MTESPLEAAQRSLTKPERTSGSSPSPLLLVGALILIAAIVAVLVTVLGGSDENAIVPGEFGGEGIPEVAPVTVVGAPLDAFSSATEDTALGVVAPLVTATSLASGDSIELGQGQARIIGFFAHWCPHCQAELPELTTWLEAGSLPDDVEFVGVSTVVAADRGNYPPSSWFNAERWPAQVLVDDANATLLSAYGFTGFPAFIAIDANGVVVDRVGGNVGTAGFDRLAAAVG